MDRRSRGGWYRCGQSSLGVGPPLNSVFLGDLEQRLTTGEIVQPQSAGAHTRLSVHVLGIYNHAIGEHRPSRDFATSGSNLQAIKSCYLMPPPLHSPDGRIERRQTFGLAESGDIQPPAPMVDGVHQARKLDAAGCLSSNFGGDETLTGGFGVSPRGKDKK